MIDANAANALLKYEFKWGTSEAAWVERELREFQGRLARCLDLESPSRVADLQEMRPTLQKLASVVCPANRGWVADALAIVPEG